jgi:hypothetical protein
MAVLGIVFAVVVTIVIVYFVVYTLPALVRKAVRAIKQKRNQPTTQADSEPHGTYEIYVSLRAA